MKKGLLKKLLIIGGIVFIVGVSVPAYMYFMPHRDVQAEKAAFTIKADELVDQFINNKEATNAKYLDEEGESIILVVEGEINKISENLKGEKVVLLKQKSKLMGVSCTFMLETNENLININEGDLIKIKGVVRSGAEYDEDLDLAEDVVMEKCDVVI